MLIYDISITHNHDPYNFLKNTVTKEYSFIFAFLLLVSFIITITAAVLLEKKAITPSIISSIIKNIFNAPAKFKVLLALL